jgi:hypothetical protein
MAALAGSFASAAVAGGNCACPSDFNGDNQVGPADLAELLAAWGPCAPPCPPDANGDATVGPVDLAALLAGWGQCNPIAPDNDTCANATMITAFTGSANPFCTVGANTDGPTITSGCSAPPIEQIHADVWFRFIAPVTGTAQIGVCADQPDFDVRMAVYGEGLLSGDCACPGLFGAPLLDCSTTESFVSCASGTALLVPITAGDCYTVRVGGPTNQSGSGHVDINLFIPPCELESSSALQTGGLEAFTEFGLHVDASGSNAVVSAIFDDLLLGGTNAGSARTFHYDGHEWIYDELLTSPDAFPSQRFGVDVGIDGDWAIVGAGEVDPDCPSDPNCDTGIAYIFNNENGTNWVFDQQLLPSAGTPADHFASRVDITSGRVIVAASDDDNANGVRAGAAYTYRQITFLGNLVWISAEKLIASNGDDFDEFGSDVAISGEWAIVGADHDEGGGAAYLFHETSASDWTEIDEFSPQGGNTWFGASVDIHGDIALVGSPSINGTTPGAVYVYERIDDVWYHTTTLHASDGAVGDNFGHDVAVDSALIAGSPGAIAIIGAGGANNDQGAAYVFWRVGGGWVERAKLASASASAGDSFQQVAVSGSLGLGLVGAYLDDTAGGTDVGSVFSFNGLGECTGNGVIDACDISDGLADSDDDGIPNICEP